MTNFAFYGRVSTEDQQDPESSRHWQLDRSRQLIGPTGGVIVAEYFDIGQPRSLPWKRRPEAKRLLAALADPSRGFDAVVIGEPQRAFYGNQFSLTFPIIDHHSVALWVPEVGGAIDPGSEAHDLVMNLFGGMSKGERSRIKTRVRSAMGSQTRHEGRFQGGRPPYGYALADAGPHPNPGKAADGKRLQRLEVDPNTAPVVRRIFTERLQGRGIYAIAEGLTRDGILSPSANDPGRNSHRQTSRGSWGKSAVRAILANPRYTGYAVWNKQRRDEVLLDIDDVGSGYETKMRWNDKSHWVWSEKPAHHAIIDRDTFDRVQTLSDQRAHGRGPRERSATHSYLLSGRLFCGICGRRMQSHSNKEVRYRCVYPREYALTAQIEHPKTVYVRENPIEQALDAWLATVFDPANLDDTIVLLASAAVEDTSATSAARERLKRTIADCKRRLAECEAALHAGTPLSVIAEWTNRIEHERLAAEHALIVLDADSPDVTTADDVRQLIDSAGDKVAMLTTADRATKANLYSALGIKITYEPARQTVVVEANPTTGCANERVGGGT